MRLLVVTFGMQPPWIDGRITSLRTLVEALAARGAQVQVLTTGATDCAYRDQNVDYRVLPGGSGRNWLALASQFWRMASSRQTDLVIFRPFAGFNRLNLASIALFRLLGLWRGTPFVLSLWSGPAQLLAWPRLFSAILVSSRVANSHRRIVPLAPIIDMQPVVPSPQPLLQRYGFSTDDFVGLFTYCGRIDADSLWDYTFAQRGLADLIGAAALLRDVPRIKYLVSMPMLAQETARVRLMALLRQAGVEDRFVLTHEIEDLPATLSAVDAYLYPVHIDEPSWAPISMLEAQACDTPVITTRIPAILEFATDGEILLYEPGQVDQLGEAIRRLASDGDLYDALVTSGRRRVRQANSSAAVAGQVAATLEQLASR